MQSPITGKEMQLNVRESTLAVRKEQFPVRYQVWYCEDSGEEFEDQEMVEANIRQAADQYRSKHNLPFPEEIKEIREQYGISASKMSEVLRFGINQYKQYENGELPSESNASLIFLARNPLDFIRLVELSNLEENEKENLIEKACKISEKKIQWQEKEWTLQVLMGDTKPDKERGFRRPDLFQIAGMVRYFAEKASPYKTHMNKLLFYADFVHFRRHGRSISGAKYRAIEMGPVPNNFDAIFQFAENEGYIKMVHHEYPNGSIGTKFSLNENFEKPTSLSDLEIKSMYDVYQRFKGAKSQEIIRTSHAEVAWTKNVDSRSYINYLDSYLIKAL